jgi:hypothetical protein
MRRQKQKQKQRKRLRLKLYLGVFLPYRLGNWPGNWAEDSYQRVSNVE